MRVDVRLPDRDLLVEVGPERAGQPLTQILRTQGVPLNTRCGERGLCRSCVIERRKGDGWEDVQSCLLNVDGPMEVRIPRGALLNYRPSVLSDYRMGRRQARSPWLPGCRRVACVDIGTTTVALEIVDPVRQRVLARASGFNRQMSLGDDVLTRINICLTEPERTAEFQTLISGLLNDLAAQTGIEPDAWILSGNSTMLHLALGVNPGPMGAAPFPPVFLGVQSLEAADIGLAGGRAPVRTLPGAAAYVGADIMAGVVASGFAAEEGPCLFVDIGTNGEMVFVDKGHRLCCATAAGPAFEGSGLECGVRAGAGAITKVSIEQDLSFTQIGGLNSSGKPLRPIGMCGTAYVDFVAQARRAGWLKSNGRVDPARVPADRLKKDDYGHAVEVALAEGKRPIVVRDIDVARLLQAKAAIAAGMLILLGRAGREPKDVKRLYLAGGFGMHLDLDSAIGMGLIPGFSRRQVRLVGNTSLAGAHAACRDAGAVREMEEFTAGMEVVELNQDPYFEDCYIDQLMLD